MRKRDVHPRGFIDVKHDGERLENKRERVVRRLAEERPDILREARGHRYQDCIVDASAEADLAVSGGRI